MKHWRVEIEFEPSIFFTSDYFASTQEEAEEEHAAALWRKYNRRGEFVVRTVELAPKPDDPEGAPV